MNKIKKPRITKKNKPKIKKNMQKTTLIFTFKLQPQMVVTNLTVEESSLEKNDLEKMRSESDHNTIEGKIDFDIVSISDLITISLEGVGAGLSSNGSLTVNFTYNGKKLFADDKIVYADSGKFEMFETDIKLP